MLNCRMSNREMLNIHEHFVLAAAMRKGKSASSKEIWMEIEARTKHKTQIAAVYTTLDRLGIKGYVTGRWEQASEGDRPQKVFEVTDAGKEALVKTRQALDSLWDGLTINRYSARANTPKLNLKRQPAPRVRPRHGGRTP